MLVAVDLAALPSSADAELSAAGSGSAPISTPTGEEDAIEESVADEITPPDQQIPGEDDDTSAFWVISPVKPFNLSRPALVYMDDGRIKASVHFPSDKSFANFNIERKGPGFQALSAASGPGPGRFLVANAEGFSGGSLSIFTVLGQPGLYELRDTAYARDRFIIDDTDFVGVRVDETGQGTLFGNSTRDNMFSAASFSVANAQAISQLIIGGSNLFVSNLDSVPGMVSVEIFSSSGDKLQGEKVSLDPKELKQFEVPGPFGAGYALFRSPLEFVSQVIWQTKELLGIPNVGVRGDEGGPSWSVIAFNNDEIRSGVAIANPGGEKDCTATYDDKENEIVFTVDFALGAKTSLPTFLEELFTGLADAGDTTGLFGVSCTGMDLNPADLIPAGRDEHLAVMICSPRRR